MRSDLHLFVYNLYREIDILFYCYSDSQQHYKLDFEVGDFFMFGSPLALVLAYRKISKGSDKNSNIKRPSVNQVYNLFHPTDPVAARLEPLISARFSLLPPVNTARYQKYPLGNGQPYHLCTYRLFRIHLLGKIGGT